MKKQRNILILGLVLLTTTSVFSINRRMMEDKTMIGIQAAVVLPMELDGHKSLNGAIGGGVRGKYFGTNTFAFGFDFGFFTPKITPERLEFATDSILRDFQEYQRLGRIDSNAQVLDVAGNAQYIPFNISFEFYLPSRSLTNFRPYAAIGLGLNIINRRYTPIYNVEKNPKILQFEENIQLSSSKGFISLNPTIGFLWTLDELWNINVDLRYNGLLVKPFGSGALSIHFGVILDLGFKYVR
jgi:outer membrane protein W